MLRYLLSFVFAVGAVNLYAACDFTTAEYLTELNNPKSIKSIEVNVPKSAKFSRNFIKILVSKSKNIPPHLKKNFRAIVSVNYDFGSCQYEAKVKQNGDWKDHIRFEEGGQPFRSLNVKLKEGNILNAVKFKLLLPETRKNLNEVLTTVFMRELGFISPETFQVATNINGVTSMMLFQEDLRKELLERNERREGPLFEGDESLLWSYEGFENFELEPLALARVSNDNWFLKGASSQEITLSAYAQLQQAYLDYSQNIDTRQSHILFPNNGEVSIFEDYFFTLFALNGMHALRPHNRRFYYNSFIRQFEPVYYDGNVELAESVNPKKVPGFATNAFSKGYEYPYQTQFTDPSFKVASLTLFKDRVLISEEKAEMFFDTAIKRINKSINEFQQTLDNRKLVNFEIKSLSDNYASYLETQQAFSLDQKLLTIEEKSETGYRLVDQDGKVYQLNINEMADLISENEIQNAKLSLIPREVEKITLSHLGINKFKMLGGEILYAQGLDLQIDEEQKSIRIRQATPKDWILFRDVYLNGWQVRFKGMEDEGLQLDESGQRFNYFGMTGCLNFYRSEFANSEVVAFDGACEDSVNFVNSKGKLSRIQVENAFADAIDIDFSKMEVDQVEVTNAGNDCFDVSGGQYILGKVNLSACSDKGISVGEKSSLQAEDVQLNLASLGVSSKDLSNVEIHKANFVNTDICYEAAQKKQEFGGARLFIESLSCQGKIVKDKNSIFETRK